MQCRTFDRQHVCFFRKLRTTRVGVCQWSVTSYFRESSAVLDPGNKLQQGGVETVTLTQAQLPVITPTVTVHAQNGAGNNADPTNTVWSVLSRQNIYSNAAPNVTMNPSAVTVNAFGEGQSHENRPPYVAMNWIIALQGIFPSRN